MAQDWGSIAGLFTGTVLLRPYVFAFLCAFLVVAGRDLGWRRATMWLCWGWTVAFVAEYSSTRTGIPFGLYHYTGYTADQELFISNVPIFDPLSFPFLAYSAWCVARIALGPGRRRAPVLLGGLLMMLADVVIDPMAVIGEKWFLGKVFYYAEPDDADDEPPGEVRQRHPEIDAAVRVVEDTAEEPSITAHGQRIDDDVERHHERPAQEHGRRA